MCCNDRGFFSTVNGIDLKVNRLVLARTYFTLGVPLSYDLDIDIMVYDGDLNDTFTDDIRNYDYTFYLSRGPTVDLQSDLNIERSRG